MASPTRLITAFERCHQPASDLPGRRRDVAKYKIWHHRTPTLLGAIGREGAQEAATQPPPDAPETGCPDSELRQENAVNQPDNAVGCLHALAVNLGAVNACIDSVMEDEHLLALERRPNLGLAPAPRVLE